MTVLETRVLHGHRVVAVSTECIGGKHDVCELCVFADRMHCTTIPCCTREREDKEDVIFVTPDRAALVRMRGRYD